MICYRDKTFCPFWENCDNNAACGRALTDSVKRAAKEWWGSDDAPICTFEEKPDCHSDNTNSDLP